MQHRYVFDPSTGQPLVQYDGADTAHRKFLSSDERGSIIARTDAGGAVIGINTYDEYGKPGAANLGRYQYTGQKWIGEAGLYDYKARDYLPQLGIFAQTDPVGYADSPNLYAYVLDDPVNLVDELGLSCGGPAVWDGHAWVVTACQNGPPPGGPLGGGLGTSSGGSNDPGAARSPNDPEEIVVVGHRRSATRLPSLGQKLFQCTLSQYGVGGLGTATTLIAAGQPIPGTKPYVTPGSSKGSSIARRLLGGILPEAGPFRVPTGDFVGGRLTGRALGWTVTKGVGKAAARWVPFVGWGLLAVDVIGIGICTASE